MNMTITTASMKRTSVAASGALWRVLLVLPLCALVAACGSGSGGGLPSSNSRGVGEIINPVGVPNPVRNPGPAAAPSLPQGESFRVASSSVLRSLNGGDSYAHLTAANLRPTVSFGASADERGIRFTDSIRNPSVVAGSDALIPRERGQRSSLTDMLVTVAGEAARSRLQYALASLAVPGGGLGAGGIFELTTLGYARAGLWTAAYDDDTPDDASDDDIYLGVYEYGAAATLVVDTVRGSATYEGYALGAATEHPNAPGGYVVHGRSRLVADFSELTAQLTLYDLFLRSTEAGTGFSQVGWYSEITFPEATISDADDRFSASGGAGLRERALGFTSLPVVLLGAGATETAPLAASYEGGFYGWAPNVRGGAAGQPVETAGIWSLDSGITRLRGVFTASLSGGRIEGFDFLPPLAPANLLEVETAAVSFLNDCQPSSGCFFNGSYVMRRGGDGGYVNLGHLASVFSFPEPPATFAAPAGAAAYRAGALRLEVSSGGGFSLLERRLYEGRVEDGRAYFGDAGADDGFPLLQNDALVEKQLHYVAAAWGVANDRADFSAEIEGTGHALPADLTLPQGATALGAGVVREFTEYVSYGMWAAHYENAPAVGGESLHYGVFQYGLPSAPLSRAHDPDNPPLVSSATYSGGAFGFVEGTVAGVRRSFALAGSSRLTVRFESGLAPPNPDLPGESGPVSLRDSGALLFLQNLRLVDIGVGAEPQAATPLNVSLAFGRVPFGGGDSFPDGTDRYGGITEVQVSGGDEAALTALLGALDGAVGEVAGRFYGRLGDRFYPESAGTWRFAQGSILGRGVFGAKVVNVAPESFFSLLEGDADAFMTGEGLFNGADADLFELATGEDAITYGAPVASPVQEGGLGGFTFTHDGAARTLREIFVTPRSDVASAPFIEHFLGDVLAELLFAAGANTRAVRAVRPADDAAPGEGGGWVEGSGLTYANYGVWGWQEGPLAAGNAGDADTFLVPYHHGAATTEDLPESGTASYSGHVVGVVRPSGNRGSVAGLGSTRALAGTAAASVTFSGTGVSGTLTFSDLMVQATTARGNVRDAAPWGYNFTMSIAPGTGASGIMGEVTGQSGSNTSGDGRLNAPSVSGGFSGSFMALPPPPAARRRRWPGYGIFCTSAETAPTSTPVAPSAPPLMMSRV